MSHATLVFGWGNPGRGDDALGPLFVQAVERMVLPGVECLTDFQLQVEHVLDLRGRGRVLFVDAARDGALSDPLAPFQVMPLTPGRDPTWTTHAVSARSLLQVFADVEGVTPPPAWQLAIRGEQWGLGQLPSAAGQAHLEAALDWARDWLADRRGAPV